MFIEASLRIRGFRQLLCPASVDQHDLHWDRGATDAAPGVSPAGLRHYPVHLHRCLILIILVAEQVTFGVLKFT